MAVGQNINKTEQSSVHGRTCTVKEAVIVILMITKAVWIQKEKEKDQASSHRRPNTVMLS